MTIIIAIRNGNTVFMASDSAAIDTHSNKTFRSGCPKSWTQKIEGLDSVLLIGFTGNFATCHRIRHSFVWPVHHGPLDSANALVRYFVNQVQPSLIMHLIKRFANENHSVNVRAFYKENCTEWTLLVAYKKDMFILSADGDVEHVLGSYAAIGDASDVAIGALHVLETLKDPGMPWDHLEKAYEACKSCKFSVGGPLHILSTI